LNKYSFQISWYISICSRLFLKEKSFIFLSCTYYLHLHNKWGIQRQKGNIERKRERERLKVEVIVKQRAKVKIVQGLFISLPPTHHFIKEGWHIVNEDFFCFLSTQWYSFLRLNWDDFQVRWNPPLFYTTGRGDLNLIPYNLTNTFCGEVITLKKNFIYEIVTLPMKVVYKT